MTILFILDWLQWYHLYRLELFDDVSAPLDTKSYYGILPYITKVIGHSVIPFCGPYCQNLPGNNLLETTGFNFLNLYNYFLVYEDANIS